MVALPHIPLPAGWPEHARSALLHAIALAHFGLTHLRGWCADSPLARVRLATESERLKSEVAALREELRIKDARLVRIAPRQRPHYPPDERFAILTLRAARGWTAAETARRFLVTPTTIAAWMRRLDEDGPDALVQTAVPVNRFPDFVRELVRALRASLPAMGKVRIAQMLARAGVHLAPTTVRRIAKEQATTHPPPSETHEPAGTAERSRASGAEQRGPEPIEAKPARAVTAREPHHVWHCDLTLVPTVTGFWVPWIPQALAQRWPFAWWVGVVLDHYSRAVVAAALFPKEPTWAEVCALLDDAAERAGRAPKHLVSDRGVQFQAEYLAWCEQRSVRPRFGAVGQHGSIAVVERFIRSMKDEATRRILVPLSLPRMRVEVTAYSGWYNGHRPHQSLGGATPNERLAEAPPERDRIETRPRHPLAAGARRAPRLELVVRRHEGRAHLPIVELREAA